MGLTLTTKGVRITGPVVTEEEQTNNTKQQQKPKAKASGCGSGVRTSFFSSSPKCVHTWLREMCCPYIKPRAHVL
jgi:hypothetical protein